MKTKEQRAALAVRYLDPSLAAFVRTLTDLECNLLNQVEAVANQKEAADLMVSDDWRDQRTGVEISRRLRFEREICMIIQDKPLV